MKSQDDVSKILIHAATCLGMALIFDRLGKAARRGYEEALQSLIPARAKPGVLASTPGMEEILTELDNFFARRDADDAASMKK